MIATPNMTAFTLTEQQIQDIFDVAIELGYYSGFAMCISLDRMFRLGLINEEEINFIRGEINKYLNKESYMCTTLIQKGIIDCDASCEETDAACMEVYKDWANRP